MMAVYQLRQQQKVPVPLEQVWDFISSPKNLKVITPPYMGFDITSGNGDERMYEGMIIRYKVSPVLGIRTTLVTEITHVKSFHYFVDEQRVGPYTMWHHEHFVEKVEGGTLMKDIVTYQPPLGFLGSMANSLFIRRKLDEIFDFRRRAVYRIFQVK
jgi:ligand-binding SRPBCC domain-containing protein